MIKTLDSRLVFGDETTFHLSDKVNRHNAHIWGTRHSHEAVERQRHPLKSTSSVLCLKTRSIVPLKDLEMPQNSLFTLLQVVTNGFYFSTRRKTALLASGGSSLSE